MAAVTAPLRVKLVAGLDKPKPVVRPINDAIYEPLDTKVDCTRFIQIEPASNDNDPIVCKLVHSSFRARPVYQALSYRWGDMKETKNITVNGAALPVGMNLMGALRFLRRLQEPSGSRLIWIDAICINQNDDFEKARQVGLMGQIYFRAAKVIVWLGDKYSRHQKHLDRNVLEEPSRFEKEVSIRSSLAEKKTQAPSVQGSIRKSISIVRPLFGNGNADTKSLPKDSTRPTLQRSTALAMAEELIDDEYWQRLWIIQELGQARELQVGFGTWTATWAQFIAFLRPFVSSGRPLTFDLILREKTHQSHTLKQLLEDHQDALCKDSRDKVYGLVGLAVDGAGFPIGYDKSPQEVWVDTMNHMSTNHLLNANEWINFGRLVKLLLTDTTNEPATTIKDSIEWSHALSKTQELPITIEASILGSICELGPSVAEYTSNINAATDWNAALCANYKHSVAPVDKESKILLRCVLDSEDVTLCGFAASHHGGHLSLVDNEKLQQSLSSRRDSIHSQGVHSHSTASSDSASTSDGTISNSSASDLTRRSSVNSSSSSIHHALSDGLDARLYQLQSFKTGTPLPKLGIAATSAQPGDLICRVPESKRSLVIRPVTSRENNGVQIRVVGTATTSDEVVKEVAVGKEREHMLIFPPTSNTKDKSSSLLVHIDAQTLYQLIGGQS
ncbi:heterokaryon incompatibility protein-domain-containing protein [Coniella lustricola]|uniref:Heterokaryon incompatibility protein-domain-containing protein n=1 Tax=Coniella lustricola TaxID=2025994 RepID=A0A2T3A847_9PEZI|nr:heterokaryon incompatibility protein-domain-containing protein [Coniella lustricola]